MPNDYPVDTVYFYAQTDPFAEFSNFAPYGVVMRGLWWRTVEHYFQSEKFLDTAYRERIRQCSRPKDAKALGIARQVPIRGDWDAVKDQIMFEAVMKKFTTHQVLAEMLLSTHERKIVENAPMDAYWGCGPDGLGQNKLGNILVAVRQRLRSI